MTKVAYTDKERFEKFCGRLPSREFGSFLDNLTRDTDRAEYHTDDISLIEREILYSKEVLLQFKDETVQKQYIIFIEALYALYEFISQHFFLTGGKDIYGLYPEMSRSSDPKRESFWFWKKIDLDALTTEVKDAYRGFVFYTEKATAPADAGLQKTVVEQQDVSKVKLSEHKISFDDETAQLKVGVLFLVDFPSSKNEYYIMSGLFANKKCVSVGWDVLYESMAGSNSRDISTREPRKQKRTVKDAVRAINVRVKEKCNTDDDLLKMEGYSIKRLY